MRFKLYLILSVLFFSFTYAQKQCNLYEVSLDERLQNATLVVEGIVKGQEAKWDNKNQNIYTLYEIEVLGFLKGNASGQTIYLVSPGGTIGFKKHTFAHSLNLEKGNTGVFMLKTNSYPLTSSGNLYESVAFSQGFIRYDKDTKSARGVFDRYKSIENDLYLKLRSKTGRSFNRIKEIPWNQVLSRISEADDHSGHNHTQKGVLATSISSFSPTTIQAGRNVQLTITGTGFGSTQGTSYVAFKNADDGGSTYTQAYSNQYVSWSDTQIVVKVPSAAGTGTIRVNVGGTNYTSSGTLTVDYAISNLEYTYNSNTYEYSSLLRDQNGLGGYTFKYTSDVITNGKTYFENAAKAWRCDTGIQFLISSTASSVTAVADDNENTVDYSTLGTSSGVIAQAITRSSGCVVGSTLNWYVDEIDVEVNSSLSYYYGTGTPAGTQYDYYTAVLHELGHANQLGHVIDTATTPTKIMHYSLATGQSRRTIDTGASTGGNYWIDQSTASSNCSTSVHKTMNCTSTVTLSTSVTSIAENGISFTVTATQNQQNYSDVVVNLSYSGTATSGTDYTSVTSITIPAGSLSASSTITITDDSIYEGSETIIIDISSVTNGTENGTQQKTVTITDNESAPTVTLSTDVSSFTEGTGTTRTVTATLSQASATSTTVTLAYSGTATYGTDYTVSGTGTTITIAAGSTSGSLIISATDDTLYEGTETIIIDISTVTNATENGTQQKTISLFDNDSAPTVTLSASPTTIAEAAGVSTITATQSAISGLATTITLTISGTAETTDYTQTTTITIPAGSTTATITCTAIQDTIDEANETVISDITGVTNGTENGTQKVTITITDDDASPTITIATSATSISETGGTATISATSSVISEQDIVISYSLSGTATQSTDYSTVSNYILIPAGSTTSSTNMVINAISDTTMESDETVIVDVSSVTNGTESGTQQQTVTIIDDDKPTVTLSSNFSSFAEVGSTVTITATASFAPSSAVTVNLGFSGTATYNSDYSVTGTTITIPAGSTTGTITLNTIDDTNLENSESIIIDITSVTNGTENGTQQLNLELLSFGDAITVSLSKGASSIAEASGSTTFTATLSGTSYQDVIVNLDYSGTATLTSDYTRTGTSITILAGNTTGSVTVTAVEDTLDEADETIIADISSVTNGTENGTQQQTVSITDNDAQPTVTIAWSNTSIGEAITGTSNAIATLSAVSGQAVTVNLTWSGTATLNVDYTVTGSVITIPAGSLTGYVTMNNIPDTLDEASTESIGVTISSATNATIGNPSIAFMTQNDDDNPPTVTLSTGAASILEAAGSTTLTATLSTISGLNTSVTISYSGTATSGTDYINATTISIPAGDLSASITLTAIQDTFFEGNETIIADITGTINCSELGTQQQTVTIVDDDTTTLYLKILLEGFYNTTTNSMTTLKYNQGLSIDSDDVDDVTVELRNSANGSLVAMATSVLEFDGWTTVLFDSSYLGSYYIVVKHRNSIETWSANPVAFASSSVSYDFTTAASQSYGSNQVMLETGVYGVYSGDVNQDGFVDAFDVVPVMNDIDSLLEGYQLTDINGDGFVDSFDLPILFNNNDNLIEVLKPYSTARRR